MCEENHTRIVQNYDKFKIWTMKFFIFLWLNLFLLPQLKAQQVVNGLHFDGTNDYVLLGNSANLKPTDVLVIEMWAKPQNWAPSDTQYLITCSADSGYFIRIYNGALESGVYRNGEYAIVSYNVSSFTGWHHIVLIYDGEITYLYVDGQLRDSNDALGIYSIDYDDDSVILGANADATNKFFQGVLDEIRVWSVTRFISSSTIISEVLPSSTGLQAYYRCNQGIAEGDNTGINTLNDYTSNGLNGTLYNFSLSGTSSNFIKGKALRPVNQSTNITYTDHQYNQLTLSWTRPGSNKGGNGVKVFAKVNATTGNASPIDGIDYTANASFGSGSQIGTSGWYCIYDGSGTNVTVTNLNAGTAYRFHVIEYQKENGDIRYISASVTGNPSTTYTLFDPPTIQASNVSFAYLNGTSFQINWERGNGTNCIVFIAQANSGTASPIDQTTYTANTTFGSGSQIGSTGWYCIYKGTGTSVTVTGLTPGQTYRVMVIEYNGTSGFEAYLTTTNSNNPANQIADYSAPTTQAYSINFTSVNENSISFSWTPGNGTFSAVFVKEGNSGAAVPSDNTTYTANQVFGLGDEIASSGWYCVYNGNSSSTTVTGLSLGVTYRVMVCSYNGISGLEKYNINTATNNPANITTDYQAPTIQASNIVASNISESGLTLSWTSGNGTSRAIFMYEGNSGTPSPTNNTTYLANSNFGSGDQIGTSGWYCMYNGNGNTVNITGLNPATTYRVMVCEYNGTSGWEKYLVSTATGNPANTTTDFAAPTTQAYNIQFADISTSATSVYITRGNGQYVAIFAKQGDTGNANPSNNTTYAASATFGSGDQIGTSGWYCIYNGTGNYVYLTNLQPGTTYRIMACEYNGTSGAEKYNINTSTGNPSNVETEYISPTIQATNISFSNITTNSVTATWTRGNGQYCAVFIYYGSTGSPVPIDNTTYTANSTYGLGSTIGSSGWYCVYNGTGNTVNIDGLAAGQTYRLMVLEYNGSSGHEKYNSISATGNPANVTTNFSGPTTQASNITFSNIQANSFIINWTRGNGSACVVFAKMGTTGVALPVDGITYTANATFGSGSQIGNTGWYCIYNGTGNNVTLTGLSSNTAYNIMVCEYNGSGGNEQYNSNTSTNNPRSQITDFAAPTTQASNIIFSNITNNSFTVSWTSGNGTNRVVFVKAGTDGTASPVNNTTYYANTTFMNGTQIGTTGWYCVYNGNGTSVTISGLSSLTTYRVMVCEYNGTSGLQKYNTNTATNNPNNQTTTAPSSITQASNVTISNIANNSFTINWTRGNGTACIVFVKNTGNGSAFPVDNTTYTANSVFPNGSQIESTGWYCVYNGTGNTVNVSGLSSATVYRIMVCEYLGSTGNEQYNIQTNGTNPVTEVTTPSTIWNGTTWSNGTPDANTAAVIAANFSESTNINCKTLLVKGNVNMSIQNGNTITVQSDVVNNGTIRLISPNSLSPAGSFISNGNIYNNGSMIAERYISPGTLAADNYEWHFISSPIEPFTVEKTFVGDYVYRFDESFNNWISLTTGDFINTATGYMVKTINTGGKILVFKGTFQSGNISLALTNTGGTDDNGYNLVGNPYPSAIDWNASSGWTKTNLSSTIWIWNPSVNNYATWNGFVGVNGGSRYIPAMQGFFVKVNQGYTSGTLGMTNNIRVHSSQSIMRYKADDQLQLLRFLVKDNNEKSDEMVVFRANSRYNAEKFFSMDETMPQIFARVDKTNLAIVAIDSSLTAMTIPVGIYTPSEGQYQLRVTENTIDTLIWKITLKEKNINQTYTINQTSFLLSSYAADTLWFELNIEKKESTPTYTHSITQYSKIKVWSNSSIIFVDLPEDKKYIVEIYNMLGNKVASKNFNNKGKYKFDITTNGVYIVRVYNEGKPYIQKVFIKK